MNNSPTPESRLRNTEPQALDYYDYTGEAGLTHYIREMYPDHDKGVEVDMVLAKDANLLIKSKLSSECERAREEAKAEVREVLRSHFRPRTDKHYGATTDNKRKAKNTVIKEIATELKIDLNIEDLTSLTHTKL